jgi:uncharacterized protein
MIADARCTPPRAAACGLALLSLALLDCKPMQDLPQQGPGGAAALGGAEARARAPLPAATAPATQPAARQPDDTEEMSRYVRENYTKYEYRIRARDGVALFTVVYIPKDHSRTYPILLTRTPYGVEPYGVDSYPGPRATRTLQRFAPSPQFVKEGYIFAFQDVRGRMMSEGTFVDVRPYIADKKGPQDTDESSDAYDSIDWLVHNVPTNNGRVGMWGISYPGFYAAQGAIDAHPALRAVSPQAPVTDWFAGDDFHHNGALFLADAFDFYSSFGRPRPAPVTKMKWGFEYGSDDGYSFFLGLGPLSNVNERHFKREISFWNDLTEHPNLDAFWKARDPLPHYADVRPASLVVGGWFDAEDLYGTLATYQAIERGKKKGSKNSLVMGPWRHGGWNRSEGESLGDVSFGAPTARWYQKNVVLPFFERHLKNKGDGKSPEAWIFETGTNEWQAHDMWPPREARPATLWFQQGGQLGAEPPAGQEPAFDEYVSDPAKPVPHQARISSERGAEYMIDDQRFAAMRPDVLVYATGALGEDVALAGPIDASLWVSTTGTDADFVVKLIDVYPDSYPPLEPNPRQVPMGGYQQMVRAEIMRGRFRNSLERPEPFTPGEKTLVKLTLPDVAHTFRSGHRIMVQVQSTWFPLVDRNPQQMVDIYSAKAGDFRAATHRVYRGGAQASGLTVRLLRGALPAAPPDTR